MPKDSAFKSRFQPKFDPTVRVFKIHKGFVVGIGSNLTLSMKSGDTFAPEFFKDSFGPRRIKLLFEQRFLKYLDCPEVAQGVLEETLKKHAADKKAVEDAAKTAGKA